MVQVVTDDPGPLQPVEGDCGLVGTSPVFGWSGKAGQIAGWSAGGGYFIMPQESMRVIILNDNSSATYDGAGWQFMAQITAATGGTVIDLESRLVIDSILELLRMARILPQTT